MHFVIGQRDEVAREARFPLPATRQSLPVRKQRKQQNVTDVTCNARIYIDMYTLDNSSDRASWTSCSVRVLVELDL